MPTQSEVDKVDFCEQLNALKQETDHEGDFDEAQAILEEFKRPKSPSAFVQDHNLFQNSDDRTSLSTMQRAASRSAPPPVNMAGVDEGHSLDPQRARTRSLRMPTQIVDESLAVKEAPLPRYPQSGRRAKLPTASAPTPTPPLTLSARQIKGPAMRKRKRERDTIKLVPESRQIFRGYTFFYIPNDDIAPVRRARIKKAREYGATWTSIWDEEGPTHIIVDKGIRYQDIISYLKIPGIPAKMIMVLDGYPMDCVNFRAILDHTQRQYQVTGYEVAKEEKAALQTNSLISVMSPQLEPVQRKPGKWDYVPRRATTPPTEESTPEDASKECLERPPAELAPDVETMLNLENQEGCAPSMLQIPVAGDELDEMIQEARCHKHLPLDEDEDDRPPSRDDTESPAVTDDDTESPSPTKKPPSVRRKICKGTSRQEHFSCMKGGTGKTSDSNANVRTITILQEMADYYARINDTWRPIAYRKAISSLRRQPNKISSAEEALRLPSVGQRLAQKIEEIVRTDSLQRLENAKAEPGDHILQKFMGIYGVGFSQATKWLHSGYRTFEDLREHVTLSENQLVGIDHYEDFQTRIPRHEVTALGAIVRAAAATIDPAVEVIIGGSYRRGAVSSGDIDCIITKPLTSSSKEIFPTLQALISLLEAQNFLVAALAVPRAESGTKWHGCCTLPGPARPLWRRIDLLLVPASELGAALLYFTGNDIFNRSIRLLASRKGMRLNQRGLYRNVMRGPGRSKMNEGELVEGADEKRIFAALGVPWRTPEQRIC